MPRLEQKMAMCRLATLLILVGVGLPHLWPSCRGVGLPHLPSCGVGLPHLQWHFLMAPKGRPPSMPTQELARRASLETHVTQIAAARLLQPSAGNGKGKGKGKGFSLRQARRRFAELVTRPSLECTPYGHIVKQLEVEIDRGPVQLDYVCPHSWLYLSLIHISEPTRPY